MLGIVQAVLPGCFFHDLEHVHRRLAPASMVLLTLIIVINLCRANNDGRAGTLGTARAKVLIRRGTSAVPHGSTGSSCGTAAALHRDVSRWAAGGLFEEPCGTIRCEALLLAGCTPGHVSLPRSGHSIAGIDHRTVARCRDLRFGDLGRTAQQRPGACTGKTNNPHTTSLARGKVRAFRRPPLPSAQMACAPRIVS